jgi:hypothetical protein
VRASLGQKSGRVGLAVGLTIVLLSAAIFWWLPELVQQRIQARLAPHGLTFHADKLGFGIGEVQARGVVVTLAEGARKPLFRAQRLDVQVSLFGALRGVSLDGGTVELSSELINRLRRRAPGAARPVAATEQPRALPEFVATNLRVVLTDSEGALMTAVGVDVAVRDRAFTAGARQLTIGELPGEVVEVHDTSLTGELLGRQPRLSRAAVKHAALRWTTVPSAAGRGETLARLRRFRSALSGDAKASLPSGSPPPAAEPAVALWTEDARIELAAVEVLDVAPSGEATPIVEQLRIDARAKGARTLQLTGKGKVRGDSAHAGGSVAWDFTVTPAELKLEGRLKLDNVALSLLAPVLPPLPFYELDRTRVHCDVQITGVGLQAAAVKGDLQIVDLGFASEGLAKYPVGPISFSASGEATWTPARRELSGVKATMRTGAVGISISGSLAWPQGAYKVDVVADMAKASCQNVLAAVPAGLLDELATLSLGGDIAGKLTVHVDAEDLDATKVDFDVKDKCKFVELPELLDLKRFTRPFAHVAFEPDGSVFEMETGPGSSAWTPIEQISPFMTQAVIAHEDGRFMGHHGFAEPEIANALARNLKAHAFRFGASTITMQLVKNVFLHRDKLLSRKVQEALIVWWLEQSWDKKRILELYLNVIEYGPSIYGIRDAALHYFGTIPLNLTPAQAGFLATILPAPKSFHEYYEKKKLSDSMKSRIGKFLEHMRSRERIDEEALQFGLEELKTFKFYDPSQPPPVPVPVRGMAQPLPFAAPAAGASMGFNPWEVSFEEDGSFR